MNLSLGTCGLNCDSKPTETHFILVCSLRPRIIQNHSVSPVGTIQWPAQLLANDFVKYGIRCSVIPDKRSWCTWCRRLKDTTICNLFMIHPLQTWEIMLGYVNVLWFDMVWYITLHYVGTTLSLSLTMSHYISGWYVRTGIVTASGRSNELVSVVGLGMQCKSVKTEPCLPWHYFGLKVQDPQKETTQIPSNTIKRHQIPFNSTCETKDVLLQSAQARLRRPAFSCLLGQLHLNRSWFWQVSALLWRGATWSTCARLHVPWSRLSVVSIVYLVTQCFQGRSKEVPQVKKCLIGPASSLASPGARDMFNGSWLCFMHIFLQSSWESTCQWCPIMNNSYLSKGVVDCLELLI